MQRIKIFFVALMGDTKLDTSTYMYVDKSADFWFTTGERRLNLLVDQKLNIHKT